MTALFAAMWYIGRNHGAGHIPAKQHGNKLLLSCTEQYIQSEKTAQRKHLLDIRSNLCPLYNANVTITLCGSPSRHFNVTQNKFNTPSAHIRAHTGHRTRAVGQMNYCFWIISPLCWCAHLPEGMEFQFWCSQRLEAVSPLDHEPYATVHCHNP